MNVLIANIFHDQNAFRNPELPHIFEQYVYAYKLRVMNF